MVDVDESSGESNLFRKLQPGRPVKAPLLLWGPYLWADGVNPRAEDGMIWRCDDTIPHNVCDDPVSTPTDVTSDYKHPSLHGQVKVAEMLYDFFTSHPTALPWFAGVDTSGSGGGTNSETNPPSGGLSSNVGESSVNSNGGTSVSGGCSHGPNGGLLIVFLLSTWLCIRFVAYRASL